MVSLVTRALSAMDTKTNSQSRQNTDLSTARLPHTCRSLIIAASLGIGLLSGCGEDSEPGNAIQKLVGDGTEASTETVESTLETDQTSAVSTDAASNTGSETEVDTGDASESIVKKEVVTPVVTEKSDETIGDRVDDGIEKTQSAAEDLVDKSKTGARGLLEKSKQAASEATNKAKAVATDAADKSRELGAKASASVKEKTSDIVEKAANVAETTGDKTRSGLESAANKGSQLKAAAKEKADQVLESGKNVAQKGVDAARTGSEKVLDKADAVLENDTETVPATTSESQ